MPSFHCHFLFASLYGLKSGLFVRPPHPNEMFTDASEHESNYVPRFSLFTFCHAKNLLRFYVTNQHAAICIPEVWEKLCFFFIHKAKLLCDFEQRIFIGYNDLNVNLTKLFLAELENWCSQTLIVQSDWAWATKKENTHIALNASSILVEAHTARDLQLHLQYMVVLQISKSRYWINVKMYATLFRFYFKKCWNPCTKSSVSIAY